MNCFPNNNPFGVSSYFCFPWFIPECPNGSGSVSLFSDRTTGVTTNLTGAETTILRQDAGADLGIDIPAGTGTNALLLIGGAVAQNNGGTGDVAYIQPKVNSVALVPGPLCQDVGDQSPKTLNGIYPLVLSGATQIRLTWRSAFGGTLQVDPSEATRPSFFQIAALVF